MQVFLCSGNGILSTVFFSRSDLIRSEKSVHSPNFIYII